MKVLSVASILALAIATQSAVTNAAPALHTVTQYVEPVTVTIKSSASPDTPYQTSPTSEDTSDETSPASEDTPDEASSAAEPEESGSADASDWVTKMICAINSVRSKEGLQPLGISSQLNSIADKHSEYQNSIGQMTHDDPAGGVGERLSALGVNWSNAAENVAAGMTTPEEAQRALEASPAHLANMVDPGMNFVGAGRANNYYTQNFYGDGSAAAAVNVPQC
ncbi:hypothetical protein GGF46_001336 [Coemansia sp. RSA 552]|nr:hypothetical protein GGF46_001336 [Coemansia sp. RSA 552]